MSPKTPRKTISSPLHKSPETIATTDTFESQPDISIRATGPDAHGTYSNSHPVPTTRPVDPVSITPAVVITAMHGQSAGISALHAIPVREYWLSKAFVRGMGEPNEEGFLYIVGRKFVEVEHEGLLQMAHVDFDSVMGAYRLKKLSERNPLGPPVYKNPTRLTWRLSESPAVTDVLEVASSTAQKRPLPAANQPTEAKRNRPTDPPRRIDTAHYVLTGRSPDRQGYYEFAPRAQPHSGAPHTLFAFADGHGGWTHIDTPTGGFDAQPVYLKHWTDQEIWELYGIEGQAIERFRSQAQTSGQRPDWVTPNEARNPAMALIRDSLRWLYPGMSPTQRETWLQSYNLLPSQLTRLQQHMNTQLVMPEWAAAHKRMTEDATAPQHLTQISEQFAAELNLKRGARHPWYDPEKSLTGAFREALLTRMGYLRNKNNCLYRTDVPALFRGDDRTPFELANDSAMLPRYAHTAGATTDKPISATFSLNEAQMYGSAPDPEYLRFNTQRNKHPGRATDDSSSDSDSDTDSISTSTDSDNDDSIGWDHDRRYTTTRDRQQVMFIYALDTRGLEVMPREENYSFNLSATDNPVTWFPDDNFEGLVSVNKKGINADRIWLLDSSLSKGAKVDDINELAADRAEYIEEMTHAGSRNTFEYDQLINAVEAAGKPILRLSGKKDEFADDIIWP